VASADGDGDEDAAAVERARAKRQSKRERKAAGQAARVSAAQAGAYQGPDLGALEGRRFEEILRREALVLFRMEPDGHCLFNAIAHQMQVVGGQEMDYREARRLAAERIAQEGEHYAAFLDLDEDAAAGSESGASPDGVHTGLRGIEAYCRRVRDTTLWGGHIELDALAKALRRPILVYQSDAEPLRFGDAAAADGAGRAPLRICFRRFAYSLGEHYDSLVPLETAQTLKQQDEDESEGGGNSNAADEGDEDYVDGQQGHFYT
jgi:OTU domain-containing protein 6